MITKRHEFFSYVLRILMPTALVAHVGCATLSDQSPTTKPLPVVVAPLFQVCLPSEGAIKVIADIKQTRQKLNFDWFSQAKTDFSGEITDPIGRTLLRFDVKETGIEKTGGRMPWPKTPISVDEGKLTYDDYFAGLFIHELPCLFMFKFPSDWLNTTRILTEDAQKIVIKTNSKSRDIELNLHKRSPQLASSSLNQSVFPISKACARISFTPSFYIWQRQEVLFCYGFGANAGAVKGDMRHQGKIIGEWEAVP